MPSPAVISSEDVDRTISAFTRLDQRGDKKAMNKLAGRLQREQPHLLQYAAAIRTDHGDKAGEAAVFYATLVWAMFDREREGTLPRITAQNLGDADETITAAHAADPGLAERAVHERYAPTQAEAQPHVFVRIRGNIFSYTGYFYRNII